MELIRDIKRNLYNVPGWRTRRKIVVFESDDWGSVRMPSLEARDRLIAKGIKFLEDGYDNVDTLADEQDLSELFNVLTKFRDNNGNHPVITANIVVANPDFEKIKESGYREYHYELFTQTLKRYPRHERSFELWKQGMAANIFRPQFHAREHLNVQVWLKALQNNNKNVLDAFDEHLWSLRLNEGGIRHLMETYNYSLLSEFDFIKESVKEGLDIFENIFSYRSKSMIAPCFVWNSEIEKIAIEGGVRYFQGAPVQKLPCSSSTRKKYRYTGQTDSAGGLYLVRNASFEPSQTGVNNSIEACLNDIELAFKWNKPAIISSHRLNFIGNLNAKNRDDNLRNLQILLKKILNRYPNVEFLSSDRLGEIIDEKNSNNK